MATRTTLIVQGVYYLVTGIWPILSRRTFERVTGPKMDFWLVRTFGALIGVVGGVLTYAGMRRKVDGPVSMLALGSAAALGASDGIYAIKGRISPVYLLDGVVEIMLIVALCLGSSREEKNRQR